MANVPLISEGRDSSRLIKHVNLANKTPNQNLEITPDFFNLQIKYFLMLSNESLKF